MINRFATIVAITLFMAGCESNEFKSIGHGISQRIIRLPLEEKSIQESDFFSARISFGKVGQPALHSFQLYHHHPGTQTSAEKSGDKLHSAVITLLAELKEGEQRIIRLPFSYVDDTFLTAYSDATIAAMNDEFQIDIHLLKTFNKIEFAKHLTAMAQHDEISETEAIEIFLMNDTMHDYERFDEIFIQRVEAKGNENVNAADIITLTYHTSLLDFVPVDNTTQLEWLRGTSGQLTPGLSQGISRCMCGDSVRIFMPSSAAFGEMGSRGGIIPSKSPVVNHVRIQCRKTSKLGS